MLSRAFHSLYTKFSKFILQALFPCRQSPKTPKFTSTPAAKECDGSVLGDVAKETEDQTAGGQVRRPVIEIRRANKLNC